MLSGGVWQTQREKESAPISGESGRRLGNRALMRSGYCGKRNSVLPETLSGTVCLHNPRNDGGFLLCNRYGPDNAEAAASGNELGKFPDSVCADRNRSGVGNAETA